MQAENFSPSRAYDLLAEPTAKINDVPQSFLPNSYYEAYLKIHKVLVGQRGGSRLEDIYSALKDESMPRYLSVAGWSAAEAALAQDKKPSEYRLELLDSARDCWQRALIGQKQLNELGQDHLLDHTDPYRTALDLAFIPLFEDLVQGGIHPETNKMVFEDCLNIAQHNALRMYLMRQRGTLKGLSDHVGLEFELNALLAFNRQQSENWFVIPAMLRSDNGYHHRHQTHDLVVVSQRWGKLLSMTPVEIKSGAGQKIRRRYKSLLVRGRMNLSIGDGNSTEDTLQAITACHEGTATDREWQVANGITECFRTMVRDYHAGSQLGNIATSRSILMFRDSSQVQPRNARPQAA